MTKINNSPLNQIPARASKLEPTTDIKSINYYQNFKEDVANLAKDILINKSFFNKKTVLLSEKLEKKIIKIDKLISENELNKSAIKLNNLMITTMKLHQAYMKDLAKDTEGNIPPTPLTVFLKRVEKLDKLLKNSSNNYLSHKEFTDKMLNFTKNVLISVNSTELKEIESPSASTCYFVSSPGESDKLMIYKPIQGDAAVFETVPTGSGFQRQMSAYLIDRLNGGQLNVPLSALGNEETLGLGSIQMFRKNDGEIRNLSPDEMDQISKDELHLVSIHRGRLYDLDGHLGNILFKRKSESSIELIPIDFDYILPEITDENGAEQSLLKMGWRFFSQLDEPFSEKTIQYLQQIDLENESGILEQLGITGPAIQLFQMATLAWKLGSEKGLTAGEIVDYLDSKKFKELYLSLRNIEDWNEITPPLEEHFDNYIAALSEHKEVFQQMKEMIKEQKFEEAVSGIKDLFYAGFTRLAFNAARELISSKAQIEEEAIEFLKGYARLAGHDKYDGYVSLLQAYQRIGNEEKATELDRWIKENFS